MSNADDVTRWLSERAAFMEERTAILVEENSFTENVERRAQGRGAPA